MKRAAPGRLSGFLPHACRGEAGWSAREAQTMGKVTLKDMQTGQQQLLTAEEMVERLSR